MLQAQPLLTALQVGVLQPEIVACFLWELEETAGLCSQMARCGDVFVNGTISPAARLQSGTYSLLWKSH